VEDILLNHKLYFAFPEGFHRMEGEELARLRFMEAGPGGCFKDTEKHLIVTTAWKEIAGLAAMFLKAKDVASGMEAQIRKAMQPYGVRMGEAVKRDVGGKPAYGFRYGYEAEGIAMQGESLVLKEGKAYYYLHFYARAESAAEAAGVLDAILASARWV